MSKVYFTDEDTELEMKAMQKWMELFFKGYNISRQNIADRLKIDRRWLARFVNGECKDPGYTKVGKIRRFIAEHEPTVNLLSTALNDTSLRNQ